MTTYRVNEADATRAIATLEQDAIIPVIWFSSTELSAVSCSPSLHPLRRVKLYTGLRTYLEVIIPWKEDTTEYNQFFIQASVTLSITEISLMGENISNDILRWLVP